MTGRMMVAAGSGHSLAIAGVPANSKLSGLALITGNLAAVTDSQNTSFAASVSATTASVSVTPTVEVASSTVQVNGVEVVSGSHSGAIPLAEGINLISVLVTAEDGSSTSYTISVVRPADVTFQYTSATDLAADYPAFDATGLTANLSLGFSPATGTNLTIIRNTGIGFIAGQFTNLAQGQLVELTFNGVIYRFLANYYGGNGNDLVLEWASRDVRAWGLNTNGRLGDGSQTNRSLPVAVKNTGILSGRTVMAVEAGAAHSLALCYDGTVAAWGLNGSGRLGDGSTTSSSSPVAVDLTGVLSGKTVVAISAGGSHSLALCSDGTVSAWGANTSGQLGDGTTTSRELPVAVDATGALAGKSVVAVSAGAFRSVALCSDGSVVEWGNGSGIPAAVKRTGVLSGNTVVAVAAGGSHCLGLYSDGTIMAWGSNSSGQLGNGGTTSSSDPVGVLISGILAGKTVLGISAGSAHSLALCSDGTVVAWGSNSYGQIGDGSTTNRTAPVAVNGGIFTGRSVVTVAAGGHSLAICSDEAVAAWGFNNFGQLGNGTAIGSIVPIEVARTIVASGSSPVAISVGDSHNLAIAAIPANNRLSALTLSSGSLTPAFSPSVYSYAAILPEASASITVTPSVEDISAAVRVNGVDVISGNPSDSLPISVGINSIPIVVTAENGSAATYTVNALRKADINATYTSASDIPVVFPLYDATGLTVNLTLGFAPPTGTNLMVIKNTGIGFITGQFTNLAHGKALSLTHNGVTYDFVANYFGGNGNDLVLEWARRSIAAWGLNGDGQLGDNKYFDSRVPVKVIDTGFLSGKTVLSVSAGEDHSLALCSDGTVASWGKGFYGQLGKEGSPLSPVPVAVSQAGILSGKTVVAISTAFLNNLALCSDGTLASWGYGQGQLGNGTNSSGFVPVAVTQTGVLAGKSVVAISVGGYHSLALCSDGRVVAWGRNTYGQLGDGGMIDSNVPVLVPETGALVGRKVVAITTGLYHSLALCSDGTVVAWGRNITGQLGNGTTVDSVVPVSVIHKGALLGKTVTALSQGAEQHSVVLCADGTIVAWGGNNNGQLGRGTSSSFGSSPAAVSSTGILNGKTVVGVSSGYQHNIAICSDGAVATWGGNYSGALGNNGVFSSTAPVRVISTGELYGKVGLCGAGGMHCLIVTADPVGGYLGWIAGYAGLSNKTESGDPEGDGIPNLVEYVLHGNPGISATSIAPTISSSGTELVFSFNRVAASEENTTQIFQYSADMINWVNVPIFPAAEVALGTVDANGNQEVTVTVPKEANTQLFGRLKVSLP
jgi:alpha-tubulin suppressor-like RCC1 family protein